MRSHPGRTSEVLKRREAAKFRHESGVEANTQTTIAKGSNNLSVTDVSEHLVRVCACQAIRPAASRLPPSGTSEYGRVGPQSAHNTTASCKFSCAPAVSKTYQHRRYRKLLSKCNFTASRRLRNSRYGYTIHPRDQQGAGRHVWRCSRNMQSRFPVHHVLKFFRLGSSPCFYP